MINIAYIIDSILSPTGGTEKQLLMLMEGLDKAKFRPHLICLQNSDWLKTQELPFEVYILNVQSLGSFGFIKGLIRFRKLHKEKNFDIVQTFFADGNFFGTIAAKFSGVKSLISSRRNHGGGHWHTKTWLFVLRRLSKWTTLYIANSNTVAKYTAQAEHVDIKNIVTIYNGLYLDKYEQITSEFRAENRNKLNLREDDILIGLLANWRPVKNYPLFLQAATMLHQKYPSTKFIIIGKLPPDDIYRAYLSKYNTDKFVTYFGATKNTIELLSAMDIGVLCSRAESLSNAILEYLSSGLPCAVSQAGGNAEAIGYGKCGLIFEENNVNDFCKSIEILINDKDLRDKYSKAGKEFVRSRFGYEEMIKRHEEVYERLALRYLKQI